jgi:hypothetical protein
LLQFLKCSFYGWMVQHVQVNLGWDIENVSRPLQELNRIFSQKKVCVISFLMSRLPIHSIYWTVQFYN